MIFLVKKKINTRRAFVILFAMLVSGLMLLIAAGMYHLVEKQLRLSSYARESQVAFYAADAALDCALFYDNSPITDLNIQPSGLPYFPVDTAAAGSGEIHCGGLEPIRVHRLEARTGFTNQANTSYVFRYAPKPFQVLPSGGERVSRDVGCAYVLIEKNHGSTTISSGTPSVSTTTHTYNTRITAAGFNTCIQSDEESEVLDAPDTDDPRLLERRISIQYSKTSTSS